MAKVKLTVKRTLANDAERAFVLIDDRVLPFTTSDEIDIYAEEGLHFLNLIVYGPNGAKATVSITRGGVNVIVPLVCIIPTDFGVSHSSDEFTL